MNKYIIIKIEENTITPGGWAYIVKANPVTASDFLNSATKIFDHKYETYSTDEGEDTEYFVMPHSELVYNELKSVMNSDNYWFPNLEKFQYELLKLNDNSTIKIHRSIFLDTYNVPTNPKFLPPKKESELIHKEIDGYPCVLFSTLNIKDQEISNFSNGISSYFIFKDNKNTENLLFEAMILKTEKNEFWQPINLGFRIFKGKSPEGETVFFYISNELPAQTIMKNSLYIMLTLA